LNKLPEDLGVQKDSGFTTTLEGPDQNSWLDLSLKSSPKVRFGLPKQINPFASTGFALQLQPCVKLIATGTVWEQLASARASRQHPKGQQRAQSPDHWGQS